MWPGREPAKELLLPETVFITPSNINPWRGVRRPEQRFTDPQLTKMADRGLDPLTVPVVTVRSVTTDRELWASADQPRPVYLCPCPILGMQGERLRVISPAGMVKLVWPDGSIQRPRTRPGFRRRQA